MIHSNQYRTYSGKIIPPIREMINQSYDKIIINYNSEEGKKGIQELDNQPVIYTLPHLSHFDYIVCSLGIYDEELPYPRTVGGENMFEGEMGEAFTEHTGIDTVKVGGISVKREPSMRDNAALCKKLQKLIKQGDSLLVFPEIDENNKTGRSYSGEIMKFSSLVFQSAIRVAKGGKEVFIIPTSVSYDFVAEDKYLADFLKNGKSEEAENDFFKNMFSLGKGNIYIDFGEPIPVDSKDNKKELARKSQLATHKLYSVTGTSLVASALDLGATVRSGVQIFVERDMEILIENNANLRNIDEKNIESVIDNSLIAMKERGLILNGERISVNRPDVMQYYYNLIKHLFKGEME